ncbi:SDR family NAD(P)-dependent oxidoreductase [Paenibacillus sp. PCH8]|uniref:SDR family NAD(P)-dependent oxidoreductase n=1 Tax=Paenibacillus sp. PCH8 TaxID=2066524 RepID=UPI0015E39DF1|nr:SDR family NAD(P)-dependent oxidoreductase [Paenibacillus sp. PCH8]
MKNVLLHHAESASGTAIALYLLQRDMRVTASFQMASQADAFRDNLPPQWQDQVHTIVAPVIEMKAIESLVAEHAAQMQGLDLYIHGNHWVDELEELRHNPADFALQSYGLLHELFMYSRAAGAVMARKQRGQIIVPMLADSLYYNGFPSSPVYNQGALAFVKSFAKELSPFRVSVNAMTFGYFQRENNVSTGRNQRKAFDIYALKPPVPALEELVEGLGLLIDYGHGMSGQNTTWGYGIQSVL